MKFPYGIADFYKIINNGFFYQDRTDKIPLLEEAGEQLLFIRPRRFGKSLLLSMLENYYDFKKADEFEALFGHLAIGKKPTAKHNQYFVLKWDFSAVQAQGSINEIKDALHEHINQCITDFAKYYQLDINIHHKNSISSFQSLLSSLRTEPYRLYLLIDEYDNFANELMMSKQHHYEALLYGEGLLKTIFKTVKFAATSLGLDKVFITGVSPVVMSDMTSGYNVAVNIYLENKFNDLCGFHENEITLLLDNIRKDKAKNAEALALMKTFYNGYCFSEDGNHYIYNPTLSLYFLKYLQEHQSYPNNMLDENLAMDRNKLNYIAGLPHGETALLKAINEEGMTIFQLNKRFGVEDVLNQVKDQTFMASLLYYFGVLTLAGRTEFGELLLKIPNLVIRKLYAEKLQERFLPEYEDRQILEDISKALYQRGEIQGLCTFIEKRYFNILSNRDYRWTNELMLKFAFISLLFNDTFYIMESEAEINRRYLDLSMILRPEMRRYKLFDLLIEFKIIKLNELNLTATQLKTKTDKELASLPLLQQRLDEAKTQANDYIAKLSNKYGELRLKSFVVIALGFDKLLWFSLES